MGQKQSIFDAKLKAKEWQWQLKTQAKQLDVEIRKIQQEEARIKKKMHEQALKNNNDSVLELGKVVVRGQQTVKRLERTKAQMDSVCLQLTTAIATMTTSASLKLSADVMRDMNEIAKVQEVGKTMDDMRAQMAKCAEADEYMEGALRVDGEEEAASTEVQRLLEEMQLTHIAAMPSLPVAAPVQQAPAAVAPQKQAILEGAAPAPREPPRQPQQAQQPQQPQQLPQPQLPPLMQQAPQAMMPPQDMYGGQGFSPAPLQGMPAVNPGGYAGSYGGGPVAPVAPSPQQQQQQPMSQEDQDLMARLQALKGY